MNKILIGFYFTIFFLCGGLLMAQTGSLFPGQDTLNIYMGSGGNQVLIAGMDTSLINPSITVVSSNPEVLEVVQASYISGQSFGLVQIKEKGQTSTVTLVATVSHDSGEFSKNMVIQIVPYNNPGTVFEVHDVIFWQEAVPLSSVPVFDTIVQTTQGPYSNLNYDNIPLTVNMDCTGSICTGHDFFTSFYKGYFVPPTDGTYYFYMQSVNDHVLWFSGNEKISGAQIIAARSDNFGHVGTEEGNGRTKSAPQQLIAGKTYAFYATQWIVHSTEGGILFEGPGISMEYIPGEYTMPYFDVTKPSTPGNLALEWRTTNEISVTWNPSTDNEEVAGYNIYSNGIRFNHKMIKNTFLKLSNLEEKSRYNLVVTAVDLAGNESFISNTVATETHVRDTISPIPPQELQVVKATSLAMLLKWSGAEDAQTEVIGYNIYIDGNLYNSKGPVYRDSLIIYNLQPNTTYFFTFESIDAGLNISEKSNEFLASTVDFDPLGTTLGEKIGKVIVENKNTSWNQGIGLNGSYENGDMVNNPQICKLVKDFGAGVIRWGAISANSKSFLGSIGTGKVNTYGKMLHFANEIGAYFALTVGVEENIDYLTNPKIFLYLLEYLAGDASTTWGGVRASEGFIEPLLQKGKGILLEFGNEVWGGATHDAQIGADYAVYAKWVREMTEVVKSSPYYNPEKIIMVYSGQNPQLGEGNGINNQVLTDDRGNAGCLAVSGYLGGNLNYDPEVPRGNSELDYYKNTIDLFKDNLDGLVLTMKEMLKLTGTLKTFYFYESSMSTTSYNGRFGQAVMMTDYLAASMNYGSIVPSLFHLTGGQWRITQPTENYKELPQFITGKYFNRFCKGNNLKTTFVTNNKLTNSNGKEIQFDPVGTYAYNMDDKFSVLLMNRDYENNYTIQLELPAAFNIKEDAKIYTIWEDDFSSYNTNIDSVTVTLSDKMLVNVPKHSMVIVAALGDDPGFEQLPIGYYAHERPDILNVFTKNNGVINTNRGNEIISTEVLPADAFSTSAVFDILENTTNSILLPLSNSRLYVKGSGTCGDDGYLKILVYAADNHELNDTVIINVTNQGLDCQTTGTHILDETNPVLFYPNPASDIVYINKSLDSQSLLQVFNSEGRLVMQKYLFKGYEILTKNLSPGIYILGVMTSDGRYLSGKLQKL